MNKETLLTKKNVAYLLSAWAGGIVTFLLTILVYGVFLSSYDLSNMEYGIHFLSCIANGFYVATVLRWGNFHGIGKGARIGAMISFLTDAYFIGVSVAMFGTVTVWEGIMQCLVWAAINAVIGMVSAFVIDKAEPEAKAQGWAVSKETLLTKENGHFAITGVVGGIAAIVLTALIYAVILAPFLLSDTEDVNAASLLLNAQVIIFPLANIAHGFLIALVVRWGKFYKWWQGALSAMVVACMTDLYFGFRDAAVKPAGGIKEMTVPSAIQDTGIWMVLNIFLGAFIAWMLGRYIKKHGNQ